MRDTDAASMAGVARNTAATRRQCRGRSGDARAGRDAFSSLSVASSFCVASGSIVSTRNYSIVRSAVSNCRSAGWIRKSLRSAMDETMRDPSLAAAVV